jgi:TonB family protein|nr:TonB-dependent receptor [Kofleriaceae bacterium]
MRSVVVLALLCAMTTLARAQADAGSGSAGAAPQGAITKHPKLLQAVAPDYPPAALAAGKQAHVRIRIHIDATGTVSSVDVLAPAGDGFDEAAVAAAEQYVFEPAEIDGKPAAIAVETTINFVLDDKPADEPVAPLTPRQAPAQPPSEHRGPPSHAGSMDAPISLEGTAVERGTRNPVAGAIVSVAELGLDCITDDDGHFHFHGLPPGKYTVLADDTRYDRLTRAVVVAAREHVEVRLWMRPKNGNPYETVVEGEKDPLEVTKRTISHAQMTSVPGTFGDPIRVVTTLPGVARAPFGLGLLLIRGSNPDDTGIFVDGHEVPALFHFLGGPSIFNADMLDSVSLYPGGFPARFGRHHGGVVALETSDVKDDGIHGDAKVDFIDAGGYLRAPITKDLTVAIAGRRSYIDLFLGYVLPKAGSGTERVVTPVYDDLSIKVDYNLHADGHLSVFYIRSHDGLHALQKDLDTMTSEQLDSSIDFWRVIANYTRPLGGDLKLTISPAYGVDRVGVAGAEAEAAGPFTSLNVVNENMSYRARIYGKVGQRVTLDTGLDFLSRITSYTALAPIDDNLENPSGIDISPSQLFRGSQTVGLGAYVDLGIDVTPNLKLIPGLRLDSYLLDGETRGNVDPRIVARYRLDPFWTLKAYVGQFTQPPEPEALDRRFGNPNVGLEHGYHYGLGYEWRPDRLWSIDSEVYYVDRRNLVEFTDAAVMNGDGTFTYTNFDNGGHRIAYGLEAIIKREITKTFYAWLSYTFSRSKIQNSDGSYTPTSFDEPDVLNAVASWKPGAGFEVGLRYQYASGRPTTPVIGATYDADAGAYVPVYGVSKSQRIPDFSQLDARIERDWLFDTWSIGAYLDIINVTNTKNVEAIQYDYRYRQSAPVTSFPFLPTLGVRGTW